MEYNLLLWSSIQNHKNYYAIAGNPLVAGIVENKYVSLLPSHRLAYGASR